jgi:hypothetical protein
MTHDDQSAQQRWAALRIGGTILGAFAAALVIMAIVRPAMMGDMMRALSGLM